MNYYNLIYICFSYDMTFIKIIIGSDNVKSLRPAWLDSDCHQFLEKYDSTIRSSLSQYGRELLENLTALEDIENGAIE